MALFGRGTAPVAEWRQTGFDDTDWNLDPPFSVTAATATTVIDFGNASRKYVTAWFRRTFRRRPPDSPTSDLGLLRDDGASSTSTVRNSSARTCPPA
jgi:hypothetical protein